MSKATILLVGALALVFIIGVGSVNADVYTWSGTGTGEWYWGSFHAHPFQVWTAELEEDSPYGLSDGVWMDEHLRVGKFWDSNWNGTTCTGIWAAVTSAGDGYFTITFDFANDTCWGAWTSSHGYGSGAIYGHSDE